MTQGGFCSRRHSAARNKPIGIDHGVAAVALNLSDLLLCFVAQLPIQADRPLVCVVCGPNAIEDRVRLDAGLQASVYQQLLDINWNAVLSERSDAGCHGG
ncbi:hypothetical protein [Bradyrhizobium yuanmingense]